MTSEEERFPFSEAVPSIYEHFELEDPLRKMPFAFIRPKYQEPRELYVVIDGIQGRCMHGLPEALHERLDRGTADSEMST